MKSIQHKAVAAAGMAAVAVLGLAACSGDDSAPSMSSPAVSQDTPSAMSAKTGQMDPAADLVGPGCKDYAARVPTGPGSVTGMAQDPVAVAAANNPLLTTLVSAVSGKLNPNVNLVDTLDGGEFTVFAPVDSAFVKIDPATIDSLRTDSATLTKILTYHVVPGQIGPNSIDGQHKTVEGGTVTVTGSGDSLDVNGAAVICGGVHTANATVYLVDSVLMPAQ
ncbi:fasciclin domain-containing protein [Rhodococcus sp. NPDC059234]|uniref:fasciclin domain-containing protein n=1 Tax=Rhodococcus sp. NPDC059234 TaxID=3346781 RepID=UPI00366F2298